MDDSNQILQNIRPYEQDPNMIVEIERLLMKSFPMIDMVLISHLRKFYSSFPQAFYQMKKSTTIKMNLQKLLRITTHPLEVNCLRRTDMLRLIFEAAALLLIQRFPEYQELMFTSTQQLMEKYGNFQEFKNITEQEIKTLLEYRNLVVAAKAVIHPKLEYYVDLAVSCNY